MRARLLTRPSTGTAAGAARVAAPLVVAALLLSACSGEESSAEPDQDPAEVLAEAKTTFDETSGVRIVLATDDLSEDVDGLLRAEGYGTHDPAFDGEIVVRFAGIEPTVPVVAVDGTVFAQVPLTTGWSEVDPAEYGAPDPAGLMDPDTGFSSLLVATEELEQGEQVRGGTDNRDVLTTYSGTVAGDVVAGIIPTAEGDFAASYTVSDDTELRSMELTGDFYGAGSMTYTITFDDYGAEPSITAPE